MRALHGLARAALFAYPTEFRSHFGEQMLADVETDFSIADLFDFIRSGMAMRFDGIARDVAYAARRLKSAPLFVAIVVLTFALGIGANVAVFSVLENVVLRPLPFPDPGALGIIRAHDPHGNDFPATSVTDASDIRGVANVFSRVAAVSSDPQTLIVDGHPYAFNGFDVMTAFVEMTGLHAQLGRMLDAQDARPGVHDIVISDHVWHTRFGAAPSIVGRRVNLSGASWTIVGVMEPRQQLPIPSDEAVETADFLGTLPQNGTADERGARMAGTLVRLAPGVTFAQADAALHNVSQEFQRAYARNDAGWNFTVESLNAAVLGPEANAVWLVFAAVFGILLIACANVGNMLGARWSTRDRELAIRRALGASSGRIAIQLLIETAMLAALGAACGVALAYLSLYALSPSMSLFILSDTVSVDGWGLVYAIGIVAIATLFAAVGPLLSLRSHDLQAALKAAGRGGDGSRRHRIRSTLVAVEIALALVLAVVSGLMVRNIIALVQTPIGIHPQGVVVTDPVPVPRTMADPARATAFATLLARAQALPGVDRAALTLMYPLGSIGIESAAPVQGRAYAPGGAPVAGAGAITPDYFRVMGIPVIKGRSLNASDRIGSEPVVVVNQMFVAKFMSGLDPLASRVQVGRGPHSPGRWARIVGVVGNERLVDLTSPPPPMVYAPIGQQLPNFVSAVVHANGSDPASIGRELQAAFAGAFPLLPPPDTYTMDQRLARLTEPARVATVLVVVLGSIALLLACAGVFGVVSFSVTQRMREFGIRIALGATSRDIVRDVLRRSLVMTATGIVPGLALAALAANALGGQLSLVAPLDPFTFALVVVLIVLSAALASLHPAVRATHAEPVEALRYE